MREPESAPSGSSDWIPEACLDAGIQVGAPPSRAQKNGSKSGGDGVPPRSRGKAVIAAIAVGVAVVGGTSIGVLASGGDGDGGGDTAEYQEPATTASDQDEPRLDERRVPLVARLTTLTPGEASVLAAAALERDRRTDARAGRADDGAREPSNSLLPIDSDDRYRYLRRAGAVAAVLTEFGDIADRAGPFDTADGAAARVRKQLDRLSIIIARLNLGPYLRSRRLSRLVTITALQLGTLAAGDFRPEAAARLRRATERLGVLGRTIAADLERGAAFASKQDFPAARRLLADVDRRLGELAALQSLR